MLYGSYGDQGFLPVSVVVQDRIGETATPEDAALWAEGLELSFPVLADVDGEFFPVWDPAGVLPVTYVIDRDGVVVWAELGGAGGLEDLEALLQTLLDTP